MKIRFANLGTIRETELDLRPLTVIIGPNNSSKTYLAYSVYGLLHEIKNVPAEVYEPLRTVTVDPEQRFIEWSIRRLDSAFRSHIGTSCRRFEGRLPEFFQDSSGKLFRKTSFDIDVDDIDTRKLLNSSSKIFPFSTVGKQARLDFSAPIMRGLWPHLQTSKAGIHRLKVRGFVAESYLKDFLRGDVDRATPSPFILPAERNALIITYKILSNRRFKLLRDAARSRPRNAAALHDALREQGEIRYPLPVDDFLDFLADVDFPRALTENDDEDEDDDRTAGAPAFLKLAALLEAHIQSGNQLQLVPTVLGGNELRVGVGDSLSIDLYNASSSIKQLSALVLYLRYKAAPGQLLIIDEPEMNLHPASQVRLLEVLAILVKLGVQVLITTHSPYFMAHLANLAQGSSDARTQTKQAAQLYLKDRRALLSQDDISAYEMRDHRLVSLKDPDFGLRWDTLSDVFSDLQQRYFALDGLAHGKRSK